MRKKPITLTIAVFALAACGRLSEEPAARDGESIPEVARITCEADGTTSVSTSEVLAQPDGIHVVVLNQLDEPASLTGGFANFDVSPGSSDWVLQTAPGDHGVACWPFSEHGLGELSHSIPIAVRDPTRMYVPPADLECDGEMQWFSHLDYARPVEGVAPDPVDAVRRSVETLAAGDVLSLARSGYPEAQNEGTARVLLNRDARTVVIFSLMQGDDGGWVISAADGCAEVNVGF